MGNAPVENEDVTESAMDETALGAFAPHPYHSLDERGHINTVNDAWLDVLGYDRDAVVGAWFGDFLASDSRASFDRNFSDFKEAGRVCDREYELEKADGTTITVLFDGQIEYDADGSFLRTHCQFHDISERKAFEEELERQRDSLEVLNQVVRHDIRNDLQLVTAYADMLADHVEEPGEEYLDTIRENAGHAVELTRTAGETADMLLRTEDQYQDVDLLRVLDTELEDLRDAYPEAIIIAESPLPTVTVRANDLLDSVFRNLLKNAIQHNDAAVPEVRLSAEAREGVVEVRIADNGPGVPDDRKREIFGKGNKGLESTGVGLGLYLVYTLVESYGGAVWVEDSDPTGTVFVVELPIADST